MKDIKIIVAKNLREIRLKKKLTQEQLAELAGIQFRTIGYIEQKRNFASADTFNRLIKVLDIPPHSLFMDTQTNDSKKEQIIEEINALLSEFEEENLKTLYKVICALKDSL